VYELRRSTVISFFFFFSFNRDRGFGLTEITRMSSPTKWLEGTYPTTQSSEITIWIEFTADETSEINVEQALVTTYRAK